MKSDEYPKTILAFDYGQKRIGVAIKPAQQIQVEPLITIKNNSKLWQNIGHLLDLHQPDLIIIGRPRNLRGESTSQTRIAEQFAVRLKQRYNKTVTLQDEALTSEEAKKRIPKNINPKTQKALIDQFAAVIILEDFLNS